jgi:Protein of unknown function (DUF1579)
MTSDRPGDAGSVSMGSVRQTAPGAEIKRLEVFIGRWLTEGHVVGEGGAEGEPIVTSDIYEWAPGGFFVVHPAYGRIADVRVGGFEVIGYDPETGAYATHFFDSQGNTDQQTLTPDGDSWTWQGENARCTGIFSDEGQTLTAHHERRTEDGSWEPSMEVVLRKNIS